MVRIIYENEAVDIVSGKDIVLPTGTYKVVGKVKFAGTDKIELLLEKKEDGRDEGVKKQGRKTGRLQTRDYLRGRSRH